jgi:hypothetical protein
MKKTALLVLLFLLTGMLSACAGESVPPPTPTLTTGERWLEAGDYIGEMRLIRDDGETPWIWDYCDVETPWEGTTIIRQCDVPLSPTLFVGLGWVLDSWEAVDAGWQADSESWVLYLDDQPIDLVSFGVLDFEADGLMFRMWNVVIENIQPGAHSLRYTFTEGGVNYDATWEFNVIDG